MAFARTKAQWVEISFMQLYSADATIFSKKKIRIFFAPQNIKKLPSKVAHNPTRPPDFSPANFCFVKLRQF